MEPDVDINLDKYGMVDGYPETQGIYSAFMAGWKLGRKQAKETN